MGQPNWFIDILRMLFRFIDYVAYWLVNWVYQLFIMISESGVFSPRTIGNFAGRIYVLLGVFMLFKVSFSLITYILNPDSFADKNKGIGKLLTNFFVVLIGIVIVPYAFQAAYRLQAIILEENVIGNLIMGINSEDNNNGMSAEEGVSYIEEGGKRMAFTTLSAFIRLNPLLVGEDCANNPIDTVNGELKMSSSCTSNTESSALKVKTNYEDYNVDELLVEAYKTNNVSLFTTTDLVTLKAVNNRGTEYYVMDYTVIISTVAGGFLAWILILFCIDIATRSVKLGFLQLIAPVPIISYVDPKGQDMFKKWLKECGKTYADLFIRLVAIYFVIFIISELTRNGAYNVVTGQTQTINSFSDLLVKIFIIFGALMFAKQLPDLISNITGVKFSGGGFTLNPMKKLGQSPYAAGAMGLVGGAIGGGIANAYAAHQNKLGFRKGLASTLGGVVGAGRRGLMAGATSGGKGSLFDGAVKGITDSSARRNLRKYGQVDKDGNPVRGYTTGDMLIDKATTMAGVKYSGGTSSALKSDLNLLQEKLKNAQMNEQNNSSALQHRISEQGNKMSALLATFNGAYTTDKKGNLEKYVTKTYDDYLEQAGRQYVKEQGFDWDTISQTDRDAVLASLVNSNYVVDASTFGALNSLYEARNNADVEGRGLQKQIKDMQEDMEKYKGGTKKPS